MTMLSLQRMQIILGVQVFVLLCLGSFVWSRQIPEDYDLRRLYSYAYKRYPSYDFGLGKRSLEEAASYEDTGYPYPLDAYTNALMMNSNAGMDKRATPSGMYSFGLGKRNQQRYYGFGLGKREQAWRGLTGPSPSLFQTNRQERRSKIYSFGLGKRQSPTALELEDDYEFPAAATINSGDKRSQARQFSFGLGKRDTADSSADHVKSTS